MNNLSKLSLIAFVLAMIFSLVLTAVPSFASSDQFDLTVRHEINGVALGLDKNLPADVYVNGNKAFTFNFGDRISLPLDAGAYEFQVKLAGTDITVMSFGPGEIPANVSVSIQAQLNTDKTPTMKVRVQ